MNQCGVFWINRILFRRVNLFVNEQSSSTPYLDAIAKTSEEIGIGSSYFFPAHKKGAFSPAKFRDLVGRAALELDLPELDSTDNAHAPSGPLLQSIVRMSKLFNATRTWYLVNGCTSGNHMAMVAMMKTFHSRRTATNNLHETPKFLISRDCHKSIFDGLQLTNAGATLLPCLVDPVFKVSLGPTIETISAAIMQSNDKPICGLILTRPGYHGAMLSSNSLIDIIKLCHSHNIPVLVDESHGSHLKFLDTLNGVPWDALACGADLVVQSAHKTLNSLSQCALLHLGPLVLGSQAEWEEVISHWYSVFTTTSPNSLLLASLDATQAYLSQDGREAVARTAAAVKGLKNWIKDTSGTILSLEVQNLPRHVVTDPLRICVTFPGFNAMQVDDYMCQKWGIYCELNQVNAITYPVPMGASDGDLVQLREALHDVGQKLRTSHRNITEWRMPNSNTSYPIELPPNNQFSILPQESALDGRRMKIVSLSKIHLLEGATAAETISKYPPGIPIVVRGEILTLKTLQLLQRLGDEISVMDGSSDFSMVGCTDPTLKKIKVFE